MTSFYTKEYKEQVYQKWLANGRPWFHINKSKEPTADERKIILEMKKVHELYKPKSKRDADLEKRAKEISEKYNGKLTDKVFDALDGY